MNPEDTEGLEGRLHEIETRAEAATAGPWEIVGKLVHFDRYDLDGTIRAFVVAECREREVNIARAQPEDAEFIAHARDDVPWLIAEVRRLEAFKAEVDRETRIIAEKVENIAANDEALQWLLERTKARAERAEAALASAQPATQDGPAEERS